ncbi:MAG: fatty acid desaturase family protein [Planctomycetaceae bacterium]|nr:fatty acid desaturase family protein [Planctomycetaceae bacterium]MDG2391102.1 fatty acid desaturase family protein [Planctomycetaceae bacterium]
MNASVVTTAITETDQLVEDWKKPVSPDVIKKLSTLQTWKSVLGVLTEWVIIGAVITASWHLWSVHIAAGIAGYIAAVVLIGSRQHALAIIMHESAHYRISNNRFWNELIGQMGAAWWLTIDVRFYRQLHFSHHRSPNTDDDPDWELRETGDWSFPKTRTGIFFLFLGDALGLRLLDQLQFFGRYTYQPKHPIGGWDFGKIAFYLAFFTGMSFLFGATFWKIYLMYWSVPMVTWLKVVLRFRTIAEHYALEYDHIYRDTRTTYPSWWEKILFAPKNINYHLEHHLYPSVPFYNLPRLHQELLENEDFRNNAHLTKTYMGVISECLNCESVTREEVAAKSTNTP